MPRRSPFRLALSAAERVALARLVRRHTSPYFLALRARIVLLAARGLPNLRIAERLGTRRAYVSTWRARFARERLPGLEDRARPGRPVRSDRGRWPQPEAAPGGDRCVDGDRDSLGRRTRAWRQGARGALLKEQQEARPIRTACDAAWMLADVRLRVRAWLASGDTRAEFRAPAKLPDGTRRTAVFRREPRHVDGQETVIVVDTAAPTIFAARPRRAVP